MHASLIPLIPVALLGLALGPSEEPEEPTSVSAALAGLEAETAGERLRAQRWLATELDAADLPLLAEAASGAGLEVRTRLIAAVGADDRHMQLAALLATDHDPVLRQVGRSALRKMVLRWHGDDSLAPLPDALVRSGLAGRFGGTAYSISVASEGIDAALDRIVRQLGTPLGLSGGSIGIALNPVLHVQDRAGRDPGGPGSLRMEVRDDLVGDPGQLLFDLLRERGLTVEAYAFDSPRAWLHVVDPSGAGTRQADDLLTRWVREVLDSADRTRGAGAARALAASGWPAALDWLEERWRVFGDRNALSGLLLAAGRGSVAPSLARADGVRLLLAEAELGLASAEPEHRQAGAEIARALAAMGPVGTDGSDLAAVVAEGWDRAGPQARNLRLCVLAGMGRAPEPLIAKVRAWLGEGPRGPTAVQRYGALRMLASVDFARSNVAEPLVVVAPHELFDLARVRGSVGEFDGWLRRAGGVPPPVWSYPAKLPASLDGGLRARALLWFLDVAGTERDTRKHLLYLTSPAQAAEEAVVGGVLHERALAGGASGLRDLFAATAEETDAAGRVRLERMALLAGVLAEDLQLPLAKRLITAEGVRPADLLLIGALCAGPAGDVVRPVLYAAVSADAARPLGQGADAPWVAAVERALGDLRRAGRTQEEKQLQRDLRELLRGSRHPLLPGLQDDSWPPAPGVRVVPLEALDWEFGP